MNRDYCANVEPVAGFNSSFAGNTFCLQEFFELRHRKIESCRIDIDKKRFSADSSHSAGRGKEGKWRGDDSVSRPDAHCHENQQLRIGPRGCPYSEPRSGETSNPLFKLGHFRSKDKSLRLTHLRQVSQDLRSERLKLPMQVEKRNFYHSSDTVPLRSYT